MSFICVNLQAQIQGEYYLTPYIGFSFPANKDNFKSSFTAGLSYEMGLTDAFSAGTEFNYSRLTSDVLEEVRGYFNEYLYIVAQKFNPGKYNMADISVFAKVQSNDKAKPKIQPFLKISLGVSFTSNYDASFVYRDTLRTFKTASSAGYIISPAAGFYINLPHNRITIEAQYRVNKSSDDDVRVFLLSAGFGINLKQ